MSHTLNNWGDGVSDKAYYLWESPKKNSTKIGQTYICQRTKESFNSSINGNLRVFQNHRKQAIYNHHFPSLGLKKHHD